MVMGDQPQNLGDLANAIKRTPWKRRQIVTDYFLRKDQEEQERDARDEEPPYVSLIEFGPSSWLD